MESPLWEEWVKAENPEIKYPISCSDVYTEYMGFLEKELTDARRRLYRIYRMAKTKKKKQK